MREKSRESNLCKGKRDGKEKSNERRGRWRETRNVQHEKLSVRSKVQGGHERKKIHMGQTMQKSKEENQGEKGEKQKFCDIVMKTLRNSSERRC